jgi:HAD superfamily hydrolase (TIGR01662 family)
MNHNIKVVFFDLGNTLIYDQPSAWTDVYLKADRSLRSSLLNFGINLSTRELFGKQESLLEYYYKLRAEDLEEPGIGVVLKDLLKKHKIAITDENLNSAIRRMYAVTQANWFLEDDAISTLRSLLESKLRLGLISNGSDDLNTYELLDKFKIRSYFEFIISSASFGKRKPHPGIFHAALDHFQNPPEQTLMIGDNYGADVLGASQVGMNTIWLTRRSDSSMDVLPIKAQGMVSRLSEIPALLLT